MRRTILRLHRDERGVALITAMAIMMIVLTLSVVTINLAIHNSTSSAQDRARVQAVNAAEAGVDVVFSEMRLDGYASLPCTQDGDLTTTPVEHYHVVVQYYSVYPPTGNALSCPLDRQADSPRCWNRSSAACSGEISVCLLSTACNGVDRNA